MEDVADGVVITFLDLTELKQNEAKKLAAQEARFREIFTNVITGIAITDWEGVFEEFNPAFVNLVGYSGEELNRLHFMELVHPDDREENGKRIRELQEGKTSSFEVENRFIHRDGHEVWVHKFVSALPVASGNPTHLVLMVTDVSEQRRFIGKLHESEAKTAAILASLASHIAVIDSQGQIVSTNPAWDRFGLQNQGDLTRSGVGSNYFDVCQAALGSTKDSVFASKVVEGLRYLLSGQRDQFSIEYPCHSPTEKRWFVLHATPLRYAQGGAVISHHDITERKLAEAKTYETNQRLTAILNTASDAIIMIDESGVIDSANRASETMFGYSSSELLSSNVNMLMPQPLRDTQDEYAQSMHGRGEPHILVTGREVVCRRKDGTTFSADLAVSQVDHLGLFTCIVRDVSSRKDMQKHALDIASDEQRRIGMELHDGTQQELTGLTLFATSLVELIKSKACKQIEDSAGNEPWWHFRNVDYEQLRSTTNMMVERLKDANRHVRDLAHGIMPVQIDAEGLRSALDELVDATNSTNVSCHLETIGDFSALHNSTATHLYRIAQEAVSNALRHGVASQVWVSLVQQGPRITLEIADNGLGFNSTAVAANTVVSGGLGLRTMEYRANLIGGVLQILKRPEGGTLVRCLILHEVVENG